MKSHELVAISDERERTRWKVLITKGTTGEMGKRNSPKNLQSWRNQIHIFAGLSRSFSQTLLSAPPGDGIGGREGEEGRFAVEQFSRRALA